jgi:hypothetical protein
MLHKLNITDTDSYEIKEAKDHLLFNIENSGRHFLINNKQCEVIDFELIDRILKGIQVDARKFQLLYNRLVYRQ